MSNKGMPRYAAYRNAIDLENLPMSKVPGVEAPNPFQRGRFWNVTAQHELMKYRPHLAQRLRAMAEAKE